MKINMFQFYKRTTICFFVLAIIVLSGSVLLVFAFWTGCKEDFIILISGTLISTICFCFPILLNYRQLTRVLLDTEKCTSYSFLGKILCEIQLDKNVLYSIFFVRFAYAPAVKFIAISNEPFVCEQLQKNFLEKTFYGTYNQKKIIIFPYDEKVIPYLNLDKWQTAGNDSLY